MLRRGKAKARTRDKVREPNHDKVFIGTLGIDCTEYSKRCIDSVVSESPALKFVYYDNGSDEESWATIRDWKLYNNDIHNFDVVDNGSNIGVGPGWNKIIKDGIEWGADKIIVCNNDIFFGNYTIDGMCHAYDRLREEYAETVMVTAANRTKVADELDRYKQEWKYHQHPDFSCFMVTPETVERVGYFTEQFLPAYFEDNWYHWKILLEGYKAWGTDWAPYSHIASRTRHSHPDLVTHIEFRQNKMKFYKSMQTITVDQEVADARYAHWLEKNPGNIHPNYEDVNNLALADGLIDDKVVSTLNNLSVANVMDL